jgi:asparaginyl-tRNA synthetase
MAASALRDRGEFPLHSLSLGENNLIRASAAAETFGAQERTAPGDRLVELLTSTWFRDVALISGELQAETARFFASKRMSPVAIPLTTGAISSPMGLGSDSLPVRARIAGVDTYLADSMQFLLEVGVRLVPRGAYYVSCSFRGEPVDETHLNEFMHAEVEIPGGLDDVIRLGSEYVTALADAALRSFAPRIEAAAGSVAHVERLLAYGGAIPTIRFDEAQSRLANVPNAFREIAPGIPTITRAGERALLDLIGEAVWLTHMPALACPFYQEPEPGTSACLSADLLMGIGEVLGSGERCSDGETVRRSLSAHRVEAEPYDWYIRMKDLRPLRTAGFGLGLERFIMWLLECDDIRRCTLWEREFGVTSAP